MSNRIPIVLLIGYLFFCFTSPDTLFSDNKPVKPGVQAPMQLTVYGYVHIINNPNNRRIKVQVILKLKGKPFSHADVLIGNTIVPADEPGNWFLNKKYIPGSMNISKVKITYKDIFRRNRVIAIPVTGISLLAFKEPKFTNIKPVSSKTLLVSLTEALEFGFINLSELNNNSWSSIFYSNFSGNKYLLNSSLFKLRKKYSISVTGGKYLKILGNITSNSIFSLQKSTNRKYYYGNILLKKQKVSCI